MLVKDSEPIRRGNSNGFIYPKYDSNCISGIPNAILNFFGINRESKSTIENNIEKIDLKGINKVVLIVIDGFGFNQFLKHYKKNRFFNNLTSKGEVFPLTSVFPSQTTNSLTTLNTGLTPQEHGLFEYFIYLQGIGVVNALRFESIEANNPQKLSDHGFDPKILYNSKSIHSMLKEKGIRTFTHMNTSNANSTCSKLIFEDSTIVPSLKSSDLIVNLRKSLERSNEGAYFFVHVDSLDTIAHEYGPVSNEYCAELSLISYLLNKELVERINQKTANETLILMTADHGQVNVVPYQTTYLNGSRGAIENFQVGKDRRSILPIGSPRDVFLHVKDEKLKETQELLSREIGEKALVVETKEAIKTGLFGLGDVSNEFLERTGNLIILPYRNETIWFESSDGRKLTYRGHHGGLNEEEMLVPFAIAKLNDLK